MVIEPPPHRPNPGINDAFSIVRLRGLIVSGQARRLALAELQAVLTVLLSIGEEGELPDFEKIVEHWGIDRTDAEAARAVALATLATSPAAAG